MNIFRVRLSGMTVAVGLAGLFLLSAFGSASAQVPPVGSWDFVLGGRQRGVAHVTFLENGTLQGIAVFTFVGNSVVRTNSGFVITNVFGAATVQGGWVHDRTDRISGYLNLISATSPGGTNYSTNGLSFRGSARTDRLNLLAFGSLGKVSFRGIPLAETNVVDLGDGATYLGAARVRNLPFPLLEIFELETEGPNVYTATGGGPGYSYTGTLLVSNLRQAAFYQNRGPGTGRSLVSAYAGPFNAVKRRGWLKGTDGVNSGIRYRISQAAESPGGE